MILITSSKENQETATMAAALARQIFANASPALYSVQETTGVPYRGVAVEMLVLGLGMASAMAVGQVQESDLSEIFDWKPPLERGEVDG